MNEMIPNLVLAICLLLATGCGSNLKNTTVQGAYEILGPAKVQCLRDAIVKKNASFKACDEASDVTEECSTDHIMDEYKKEGIECLSGND